MTNIDNTVHIEEELTLYSLTEVETTYNIKSRLLKTQHKEGNLPLVRIGNKYYVTKKSLKDFILNSTIGVPNE